MPRKKNTTPDMAKTIDRTALTDSEYRVLELLVQGYSSKETGEELSLTKRTVDNYRQRILLKMNARNITDLAVKAVQTEMVPLKNELYCVMDITPEDFTVKGITWILGFHDSDQIVQAVVGKPVGMFESKDLAKKVHWAIRDTFKTGNINIVEGNSEKFPGELSAIVWRRVIHPKLVGLDRVGVAIKVYRIGLV